jgi:hypothetical protein
MRKQKVVQIQQRTASPAFKVGMPCFLYIKQPFILKVCVSKYYSLLIIQYYDI